MEVFMAKIDHREILRLKDKSLSNRAIAKSLGCSRDTVSKAVRAAEKKHLTWEQAEQMTPNEVEKYLFPGRGIRGEHAQPDFEYIHHELTKKGVTLTLLHAEYCEKCEREGLLPYQRSQFCRNYREYAKRTKATLRVQHKPGEIMEVDWAGDALYIIDELTLRRIRAYLFVACLPCSQIMYAEASPSMDTEHWLTVHVHALEYFGGAPEVLVPDNLKTGITANTSEELIIAPAYRAMAEYYGMMVLPTRVRAPKDKASVERSVGICETWIIARLRNEQFTSFEELNARIRELVDCLNDQPFQKKNGSRRSTFELEEKEFLRPLPEIPYETPKWFRATVSPDYLILADGCKYSVPHEFIGCTVQVCLKRETVDITCDGTLIASHTRRESGSEPVYNPDHMPSHHRQSLKYTTDYHRDWADRTGGALGTVVKALLDCDKLPERVRLDACRRVAKLADNYTLARLQHACALICAAGSPVSDETVSTLNAILRDGRETMQPDEPVQPTGITSGITRGSTYYNHGGK